MQTQNTPKTKVTTYFDSMIYYQVKLTALERNQTISDFLQKAATKEVARIIATPKKTKSSFDKLCPGFDMGPIKGNLSREEIYDFI